MITFNDYHKDTEATFTALNPAELLPILDQYVKSRRSKKITTIQHDGKTWAIDFESERKSAFWRSRSFSFYFTCEATGELMRISDHWSQSGVARSEKLNCGTIRSCFWSCFGNAINYRLPGETYESCLIGGIVKIADMERRQYIEQAA